MSEQHKATLQRVVEQVFNGRDLDKVADLFTENYVMHDPSAPEEPRGVDGMKQYVSMFLTAFSDLRITIEDQLVNGDKVATRFSATGTHDGDLMGIAPSGNHVQVSGIIITRFENGKIAEEWQAFDTLGMLQQVGAAALAN